MPERMRVSTAALLRLLESRDSEVVCGAALVLGALKPADRRVIPALARALHAAASPVKPYILDALGRFPEERALRHVAPFLLEHGALREQAVRLMKRRSENLVPYLRRLRRERPEAESSALIKVAMEFGSPEAFEFLAAILRSARFEEARAIFSAVARKSESLASRSRRALLRSFREFLRADYGNATADIAALKILGVLGDAGSVSTILTRLDAEQPEAVREAALEALDRIELPPSSRDRIARLLLPLLEGEPRHRLGAPALRALTRIREPALETARLLHLARGRPSDLTRAALHELRRLPREEAVETLLEALSHDDPGIREAAASSLAALEGATEDLVAAHEDPRLARQRGEILRILAIRSGSVEPRAFRRLATRLLRDPGPELAGRLQVLAALDRAGTNRIIEARARRALGHGDSPRAAELLEPLVRGRQATPGGRYLLALAHLRQAEPGAPDPDPHFDRAMQLLGPLARLGDWPLRPRLLREKRLTREHLARLASHMAGRPEPEASLAAALRRRLDSASP